MADAKEKLRVRVRNVATDTFGNSAARSLVALAKEEWYSESNLVAIRNRMSSADFKQAQVERNEVYERNYDDA